MENSTEIIVETLTLYGLRVLGAAITLVIGLLIAGWLGRITERACERSPRVEPVLGRVLGKLVRIAIILFTVIATLNQFGVATTSLVALLGAAGLAIGLSLQGMLSNVASGVMLMFLRPFNVGQVIIANGSILVIDEIGLFVTRAHQPDGPLVVLPNSVLWGDEIVNLSVTQDDLRRINENFGIGYGDDMDKAIGIVHGILDADERILKEPPPMVAVGALGDSSVDLIVHAWTQRLDWFPTKLALNKKIKEEFDRQGISIPFPQRDVHLIREPEPAEE